MQIDNIQNYLYDGEFSNISNPVKTSSGDTAYLVSNYNGLYGVVLGTILVFVTDSYAFAREQYNAFAERS